MRAIKKTTAGPGVEYVADAPEPRPRDNEVLVEIAAASLCGTDREVHEWSQAAQAFRIGLPVTLGHEGAGTVLEAGRDVRGISAGDRVALESHLVCGQCFPCRTADAHTCERTRILGLHIDGVFAERVAVPADLCVPLPDEISLETGALLEAAGVGVHAVQRSGYQVAGRGVLVSGGGPVGLATAALATVMGAAFTVVVEPNPYRRAQAEKLGVEALEPGEAAVERCRELARGRGGADIAFECSGAPSALTTLFDAVRANGTVVTIGHPGRPVPLDIAAHINKKGITLKGIFGRRLWDTWEQTLLLVASGRLELDWLVTHRMRLSETADAIDLLSGDAAKILLKPGLG